MEPVSTELKHPTPLGMETLNELLPHLELVSPLTPPRSSALQATCWLEQIIIVVYHSLIHRPLPDFRCFMRSTFRVKQQKAGSGLGIRQVYHTCQCMHWQQRLWTKP